MVLHPSVRRLPETDGVGGQPQSSSKKTGHTSLEPLAIVGFATQLAGDATDNENLWSHILEGKSASGPFPQDRLQGNRYFHPDPDHGGTCATKGGYFLKKDIDTFDASFFRLSEYDIAAMDPQQKILLENVYHAFENVRGVPAGLPMESLAGSRTSVYVGSSTNDHAALTNEDLDFTIKNKATGTLPSLLANRVSWFYDLKGASVVIDTACSSSLVALHMACLDIRAGGSEMAIVSGINLLQHPASLMVLSNLGVLSPDGRSYAFDDRANGYGRGEGVVTIVIKSLQAAIRDGDQVRGLVRASGVSSDGKTAGITLPSEEEQKTLIQNVYASANLDMNETTYVEAHGTGTPVGDPLECKAIMSAFRTRRRKQTLYIGSIKANIGHLEGGAGLAGLVKAVMMLEKQIIPPIAGLQRLNPLIPQDGHNVCFAREAIPWPECQVRRASVNSFGFGGTNAHVVIESPDMFLSGRSLETIGASLAPLNNGRRTPGINYDLKIKLTVSGNSSGVNGHRKLAEGFPKSYVYMISANDEGGIQRNAMHLKEYIDKYLKQQCFLQEPKFMEDLMYTLSEKRSKMKWRASIIASSLNELSQQLTGGTLPKFRAANIEPGISFVFTGQGAQWPGMGKMLMEFPVFRQSVEAASLHLQKQGSQWTIHDAFDHIEDLKTDINNPIQSQTACTVLQVALVDLLQSWNIIPSIVIGHSSGEIAAAYCAGAISREAAWNISYYRGLVSSILVKGGGGAMIAVGLHPHEAEKYLHQLGTGFMCKIQIGCYNSPKNTTITGERNAVLALQALLDQDGVFNRVLATPVAYHSQYMLPVADTYSALLKLSDLSIGKMRQSHNKEDILMISSVTGEIISAKQLQDPQYWTQNLVSPVKFMNALQELKNLAAQFNLQELLELGPHSALQSAIRESIADAQSAASQIRYNHTITRNKMSYSTILSTAAGLFCRGYPVNLLATSFVDDSSTDLCHRNLLTDLPCYAFNHDAGLRAESRRMKNSRLPQLPRHELLGSPDPDWDQKEPRWRNFLRTSELPWLRDNKVNGGIIFPGVGYSIMAMEAVKQIADHSLSIAGYFLRQISMEAALIVPDTRDGLEVMTSLREVYEEGLTASPKYYFSVKTHDLMRNEWIEHCSGFIEPRCELSNTENLGTGRQLPWDTIHDLHSSEENCTEVKSISAFYDALERSGFDLGPTLKNLVSVRTSPSSPHCMTKMASPSIAEHMPKGFEYPYIIHPSTMESMAHAILHVCTTNEAPIGSALLARYIDNIWISNNIPMDPGHLFVTVADGGQVSPGKWRCAITVWDDVTKERVIQIRGTELCLLSAGRGDQKTVPECFLVKWYPSLDLVSGKLPFTLLSSVEADSTGKRDTNKTYEQLCTLYIAQALRNLRDYDRKLIPHHFQRYLDWMITQTVGSDAHTMRAICVENEIKLKEERETLEMLREQARGFGSRGKLLVEVGDQIVPLIKGQKDPHSITPGLDDPRPWTLDEDLSTDLKCVLSNYFKSLRRERGHLKVLELGAGTTSVASHIIEALASTEGMSRTVFGKYHYTNKHGSSLEDVRRKFGYLSHLIDFQVLDVDQSVIAQGFEEHSFDLIISAHAFTQTPSLERSLKNSHSLLKPGGKLLIIENTNTEAKCPTFVNGLFPSWWESTEPFRSTTPFVSANQWIELLEGAGFTTLSPVQNIEDKESNKTCLFVSTAVRKNQPNSTLPFADVVITHHTGEPPELVFSLVAAIKQARGLPVVTVPFSQLSQLQLEQSFVIVVGELGQGYLDLSCVDENIYQELKWLLLTCHNLLWISTDDTDHPKAALSTGLVRTLRWEREMDKINFLTLKFSESSSIPEMVSAVTTLYQYYSDGKVELSPNSEYLYKESSFWVNRLYPADNANNFLQFQISGAPQSQLLGGENWNRPLKARFKGSGRQGLLVWSDDEAFSQLLGPSEIQVDVHASGLTFQDSMAIRGDTDQHVFGKQVAGTVTQIGQKVEIFKPGDRVMALLVGPEQHSLSRSIRINENFVQQLSSDSDIMEAATIPSTFAAVHYALHRIARVVEEEKVLVHGAMYAAGQAAIQLAKLAGAEVFVTVKTPEQKHKIQMMYGVSENRIFVLDENPDAIIKEATGGPSGIDVVLNFLHGSVARLAWQCIGIMGRYIDMALKAPGRHRALDMSPFSRNAMYIGVDIAALGIAHHPAIVKAFSEVGELFRQRLITSSGHKEFSYADFGAAMIHIQNESNMDAAVIIPKADDVVQVVPRKDTAYEFPMDATYVIAGGLGGLGRSAARWMCSRGARHLILISRSGARTASAKELLQDLHSQGCKVKICQSDITDSENLQISMRECISDMPPIKGCLQSTMLLQDSIFENMSYQQFMAGINPKVQGSLNVLDAIPNNLDFFLVLSSAASIVGNRGQANYNSANAFQDSLAEHLNSKGIPGMSVNLGNMLSVGWVAENKGALPLDLVYSSIDEPEFHALLEYHLDPRWGASRSVQTCHTIAGVRSATRFNEDRTPLPTFMNNPLFTIIRESSNGTAEDSDQGREISISTLLKESKSVQDAASHVADAIICKLSGVMSFPIAEIDPSQGLASYGVDSLVTVDFRTWIAKEMGANISTADILDDGNIISLSEKITRQSKFVKVTT